MTRAFGPRTARELQNLADGAMFEGDPEHVVTNAAPLQEGGEDSICFMRDEAVPPPGRRVGLLVAPIDLVLESLPEATRPHATIRAKYPEAVWAVILGGVFPAEPVAAEGIADGAEVSAEAEVGKGAGIAAGAVIGAAQIGEGTRIGPGCTVGKDVKIGHGCTLHAGVHVYPGVTIGDRCIIHAGAVLGSDGFGYAFDGKRVVKVPQAGGVVIGSDVEIGANCTIDRGAIGDTVLEDFVKLDNLVHVAHNCVIGEGTMIAAQAGLAGSTIIHRMVQIGGQAGVAGHTEIGEGAKISAQAGVIGDIPPRSEVTGFPARARKEFMRMWAWLARAAQTKPGEDEKGGKE
ncbi:MAG: UDP-3-O-(3-hydroxymyristoyl)glucosamine N-acyltransferase [Planctomycetes bacterium]|nr:UDP-3-O-(3-hydroxymyristoyl)glucosamine N-acyltransferase [Planctomycetota bacterium]